MPDEPIEPRELDTSNWFFVARGGDRIFLATVPDVLERDEALNLAAWLVSLADPRDETFPRLLAAIRNS